MHLCWHVHVSKRIYEGRPRNFLKKFRWKVRHKCSEILEGLYWTEVLRRRHGSCVDAIHYPISLTCTNNRFDIRKSFSTSYGLYKLQLTKDILQLSILCPVCVAYGVVQRLGTAVCCSPQVFVRGPEWYLTNDKNMRGRLLDGSTHLVWPQHL